MLATTCVRNKLLVLEYYHICKFLVHTVTLTHSLAHTDAHTHTHTERSVPPFIFALVAFFSKEKKEESRKEKHKNTKTPGMPR